jgi:VWFA-related protein
LCTNLFVWLELTSREDTMPTCRPSPAAHPARRLLAAFFLAGAGSLLAAAPQQPAPAAGQAPPAAAQQEDQLQRPTFRAEANFVRVDVYPTAGGRMVQDLAQADFEVLEDGKPQEIRTFEHVLIQAGGPPETRSEPRSVQDAKDMAADPRARLIVLFLDTYHVTREGAYNVRRSLTRLLDRTLGPTDMVAVMTPEMSAGSITFTRHTGSIGELLDKWTTWGRRFEEVTQPDAIEARYQLCYPPNAGETGGQSAMAREMINRRREKLTIDAVRDLVRYLGGIREERKAILMVSEGWALFGPNSSLATMVDGRVPGPRPVGVGVGGGGLTVGDSTRNLGGASTSECDQDRIRLSQEDHQIEFRSLLDEANRGNATFYPVDPRGLPVFDTDLRQPQYGVASEHAALNNRLDSLRDLASATDGIAVLNSNDIDKGLKRVVDDLTSYYLIGYYSTNAQADGRYHSISVKVKRPGVSVRARRGYRSPTKEDLEAVARGASAAARTEASPVTRAVGSLAKIKADAFVHTMVGYDWTPSAAGAPAPSLWIAAEMDASAGTREEAWRAGADVTIVVTAADKSVVGEVKQTLKREARCALLRVPLPPTLPGDYAIRVTSKAAGATMGTTESLRVVVPRPKDDLPPLGQPLMFRRGPFTGPGWQPAGDLRYRRQERVKVELPVLGTVGATEVHLLDRTGKPLTTIPVIAATRDEDGRKIVSGEVTLAPLTTGDYVLEITVARGQTTQKMMAPFQIVP